MYTLRPNNVKLEYNLNFNYLGYTKSRSRIKLRSSKQTPRPRSEKYEIQYCYAILLIFVYLRYVVSSDSESVQGHQKKLEFDLIYWSSTVRQCFFIKWVLKPLLVYVCFQSVPFLVLLGEKQPVSALWRYSHSLRNSRSSIIYYRTRFIAFHFLPSRTKVLKCAKNKSNQNNPEPIKRQRSMSILKIRIHFLRTVNHQSWQLNNIWN